MKKWVVGSERPEERFTNPEEFYNEEEAERYSKSSGMKRAQEEIAARLIELMGAKLPARVLDVGCGTGFSADFLRSVGFDVRCVDRAKAMVAKARERGLDVIEGDAAELEHHFKENEFDYIISISAMQWVRDFKKAAASLYYVLKPGGKAGVQFYPKSEQELKSFESAFMRKFGVDITIDNPDNPRKRTIFAVLSKR